MWKDGKSGQDITISVGWQYSSIKTVGIYTSKPHSGLPSKLIIREKRTSLHFGRGQPTSLVRGQWSRVVSLKPHEAQSPSVSLVGKFREEDASLIVILVT
ncbi:hypothetical protein TNCV_843161 [Trichonephila clavipes]|nr:hypothetical protein TNCV_843161 [Trichonephila clavipes]